MDDCPPPGTTDAELVERARRGHARACDELVRRYTEMALRTAYVVTGSAADAEEAQDAFVKAHRALGRFRAGAPFRPWLRRIVGDEARSGLVGDRPVLAVSATGAALYVGTAAGVHAVDTGTLRARATGLPGQPVTAHAAAAAGRALYALTGGSQLFRLDPGTLAVAGKIATPGPLGEIPRAT